MADALQITSGGSTQNVPAPANMTRVIAPGTELMKACGRDYLTPMRYAVNDLSMMEAITQPLYSYQLYPAAGSTQLSFFQTTATGTVTLEDTNMTLTAQISQPNKFLVQGIGIDFLPGLSPVTLGADTANSQWNDFVAPFRRGWLEFIIGSKNYLNIAPLASLPPRSHLSGVGFATSATTAAANLQTLGTIAYVEGNVFGPVPLLLEAGQNFNINLRWPTAVALPSSNATSRIGVVLYGTLYRPPQ